MLPFRALTEHLRVLLALTLLILAAGAQPVQGQSEPRGPDELYSALPSDGLHDGIHPERMYKAVVLRAPMPGGSDTPTLDLPGWARPVAEGLRMRLEQKIDYLPHVLNEHRQDRVERYEPRLRVGDLPIPGLNLKRGVVSESLEHAARTFAADYVFVLRFAPGTDDGPSWAAAMRYRRGEGVEAFSLMRISRAEGSTNVKAIEAVIDAVTSAVAPLVDDDGYATEVPHAPLPPLVRQDKALAPLARLRGAIEGGELTEAWIAWEELTAMEPDCGRAAIWGMEVFHALANREADAELNEDYKRRSIRAGIEALRHHPNDVMLRGRLCWNGFTFHSRQEWALAGLDQALKVQPMHPYILEWYTQVKNFWAETRAVQAEWIREYVKGKARHARIELIIGNIYFGSGDYADGVKWLSKALELAPDDHDTLISLGLCATYEAEQLMRVAPPGPDGQEMRATAGRMYRAASDALWHAIQVDPLDGEFAYDYYIRTITRSFRQLPTGLKDLDRVFLTWAARDGITSSSRTFQLDRLTEPLIRQQRMLSRRVARAAKPGDENYELHLLARLHFSVQDKQPEETVHVLWQMRELGLRPDSYHGYMRTFGPLVNEYKPE